MPAPVPPGYTRGPLLFLGPATDVDAEQQLLQHFWNAAGGYGGRLLLVAVAAEQALVNHYSHLLTTMEAATITQLTIDQRAAARQPAHEAAVANATGILLLGQSALKLAGLIGGTPLAQAIRRANATGKTLCGIGRTAAILCQHMVAFETRDQRPHPFLHRHLIQFAPGLGLVNRLVLDVEANPSVDIHTGIARLLTAVAYNPFLVGVSLEANTGIALYSDTTLEVFGVNNVIIIDGGQVETTDVHEEEAERPVTIVGAQLHALTHGYTFNFDQHIVQPPPSSDIPTGGGPDGVTF
ncbi:MAG: cyanophycinase [Caldilineaceae bacterium]